MELDVASAGLGLLTGAVVSAVTAWAIFGKFLARDAEREKHWVIWRNNIDDRLDSHASDIKDHGNRIAKLERH